MGTDGIARQALAFLLLGVFFLVPTGVGRGQDSPLVLPSAERLLREAYARTKAAPREADLTEIIRMCRQARRTEPVAEVAAYADQLTAWALNRRGEQYAQQAADLAAQDQLDKADELDAQALADFEAAVELDPQNWKALHNRGVSRALAGQLDEALADFSGVVERKPDYPNAWFNRGEVRADRGEWAQAVADYTRAIELKPADLDAYVRRSQAYLQLGKLREALADCDRSVQLAPGQIQPLLDRGDVHRRLGQWQLAAEDYRRAMALDHRSSQAYQRAAWILATCPVDRYRNGDLAVQAAEKALELDGEQGVEYLDTVAAAYANAGQFDKACETLAQAIEAAPDEAETYRSRLALYQRQQPFREPQPRRIAEP